MGSHPDDEFHPPTSDDPYRTAYSFTGEVWEHEGTGAWHFVSVPHDVADEIEEQFGSRAGGFGSVRVEVTIGATRWSTSLFPDTKRGTYLLPVKKSVRTAEGLTAGICAAVEIVVEQ